MVGDLGSAKLAARDLSRHVPCSHPELRRTWDEASLADVVARARPLPHDDGVALLDRLRVVFGAGSAETADTLDAWFDIL